MNKKVHKILKEKSMLFRHWDQKYHNFLVAEFGDEDLSDENYKNFILDFQSVLLNIFETFRRTAKGSGMCSKD